jgi:cytochrome d ubiquinol oxidase subunit II
MQRATGAIFAFSSLLTPFFMGTAVGAIAAGDVPANAGHASLAAWTSPTALLAGFLFTAACGYLAAVYLVGEAAGRGDQRMQAYFTRRARTAAIVAGALSLAALAGLHSSNRLLFDRLTGRALPLIVLAGVCGLAILALFTASRPAVARVIAALGVAAVVWGWGLAQYPVLLPGTTVTLSNAGAPDDTLVALVVLFIIAAALIGPAFALLYFLQGHRLLGGQEPAALPGAVQAYPPAVTPRQSPTAAEHPLTRTAAIGVLVVASIARRRRRT